MKTVFVVLSHTLTQEQIEDLGEAEVILLSDVSPELAAQCRQIDPGFSLEDVQELAAKVVAEAVKAEATHFVCQGEPCLALWANLFASGEAKNSPVKRFLAGKVQISFFSYGDGYLFSSLQHLDEKYNFFIKCLQSTTARTAVEQADPKTGEVFKKSVFKHVQWRELF